MIFLPFLFAISTYTGTLVFVGSTRYNINVGFTTDRTD